jgi:hypothetical protein
LDDARGLCLTETTAGVIGGGRVGSRVVRLFSALGIRCLVNDPPLADQSGDARYRPLDEALAADIVTLHVPLASQGPYPTRGLIGREALVRMKSDVILINTARGGIVNEAALLSGARGALGRSFDALRANRRERREFSAHAVRFGPSAAPLHAVLRDLGFRGGSAPAPD